LTPDANRNEHNTSNRQSHAEHVSKPTGELYPDGLNGHAAAKSQSAKTYAASLSAHDPLMMLSRFTEKATAVTASTAPTKIFAHGSKGITGK
jgi:hypothetical protein